MPTRVRYAPSPTGDLHLGSLRTVIFNWLVAHNDPEGVFIMRLEDTDQARTVEGATKRQLEAMAWMGVSPEEGVYLDVQGTIVEKGSYGPYIQSQRLETYQKYATELLNTGHAYRCFCTPERLEEMRTKQQANHQPTKYDRRCRNITRAESDKRAESEPFVLRHAIPDDQTVTANDVVRGEVSFQSKELDDYVLLKSDGFPTYQLANVVDDHLMEITTVLRGEEWLPSLPKNLLLYKAFGWQPPAYAHLPVILGPDGNHKLSKRDGEVAVIDYKTKGYLPDALFNMLAMIGWSPGTEEEFFDRATLVKRFSLDRVQKAPAVFNFQRLDFVNGWYIRHLSVGEVAEYILPYLQADGLPAERGNQVLRVAALVQERLKHFDEAPAVTWFMFKRPEVTDELRALIIPKKGTSEKTNQILQECVTVLSAIGPEEWNIDRLDECLKLHISMHNYSNMEVLWPIRTALTSVQASPGAFEMLHFLGKDESLARLQAVTW